ncbi:unnamed protein product [Camellia sinensis]
MVGGNAANASVGSALQNSFVKKIKEKVRRERKLPEFEYPMLQRRLRRVVLTLILCDEVEVVNEVDEHNKKRLGYGLNNRFAVWKLVKKDVKRKISTMYEQDGDDVVIWTGGRRVRRAFGEQTECACGMSGFPGEVVLFQWHMSVVNVSDTSRDRYLEANFRACVGSRYLHFPICHKGHWTLVLYDTKDGSWKHYNPLMSRTGSEDIHYNVASMLKRNVLDYIRRTCQAAAEDAIVYTEDGNMVLEAVSDCP